MSEAPEKIWLTPLPDSNFAWLRSPHYVDDASYTRTDIHEAALARIAELEAQIKALTTPSVSAVEAYAQEFGSVSV